MPTDREQRIFYEDDAVTLYCGDALELLPLVGQIDAIVTDPPYDSSYPLGELRMACSGNIVVFHRPERWIPDVDEHLFWVKTPSTKNYLRRCGRFVEQISVIRQGATFNVLHWSQMTGVYDDRLVDRERAHPWEKPLSLIERIIRIYTKDGDLVLDPFAGSGTTGIAARRLGRRAVLIERDEAYAENAARRLSQFELTEQHV